MLAPAAARCIGPSFRDVLRDRAVTVATLTPTAWRSVPDPSELATLRLAAAAGEALSGGLVAHLTAPGRRVLNLYGPAEAAIWASWHECRGEEGEPPIGVPITNRRLYLVDGAGRPAPDGVPGELWIGGIGIGRYLRQPALMQQVYRPDPLATQPGQLMYATGDLCRRGVDGTLSYIGRVDRQIKIRGQRIEPEEVERALEAAPGVDHATVDLVDGRLTAVVVPSPRTELDPTALAAHLRDRMHSAMVPAVIEVAAEATLSLTGKRRRLPDRPTTHDRVNGAAVSRAPGPIAPAPPIAPEPTAPRPTPIRSAPAGRTSREFTTYVWRIAKTIATQLQLPAGPNPVHLRLLHPWWGLTVALRTAGGHRAGVRGSSETRRRHPAADPRGTRPAGAAGAGAAGVSNGQPAEAPRFRRRPAQQTPAVGEIVFVHGTLDDGHGFRRVQDELPRWTTTTYDRRGWGGSTQPASLDDDVADLRNLLLRADRPVGLVGHSFGAAIACTVAATTPDHVAWVMAYEPPLPWLPWWPELAPWEELVLGAGLDPADAAERMLRAVLGDGGWDRLPPRVQQQRRSASPLLVQEMRALRDTPRGSTRSTSRHRFSSAPARTASNTIAPWRLGSPSCSPVDTT